MTILESNKEIINEVQDKLKGIEYLIFAIKKEVHEIRIGNFIRILQGNFNLLKELLVKKVLLDKYGMGSDVVDKIREELICLEQVIIDIGKKKHAIFIGQLIQPLQNQFTALKTILDKNIITPG